MYVRLVTRLFPDRSRFRSGASFTLAILDLDAFDAVNAAVGYAEGDRVLARFAAHLGDFAINLGVLCSHLGGDPAAGTRALLVFVAQFGSVFGSQVRSRAAMCGVETRDVGLFTRSERLLVLGLGLLFQHPIAALAVLAVGNNLSALQRVAAVMLSPRARAREPDR